MKQIKYSMKRISKVIIISLFTILSFFYTEKIVDLSKQNDPIMKEIEKNKNIKKTKPVNAIIKDNTILIGSSGKEIDVDKSYEKMKKAKEYSDNLLEYTNIKPSITKEKNYDKLIIGRTTNEREMSLIFKTNDIETIKQITYILKINNASATFYIDSKIIESNIEKLKELFDKKIYIGIYSYNNIFNLVSVKHTKNLLSKKFKYSNYCLYKNKKFLNACKYFRINTIKPKKIENNLYNYLKKDKRQGMIYEINPSTNNIKQLNSSLIYLKQKGYKVISLDDLLKE